MGESIAPAVSYAQHNGKILQWEYIPFCEKIQNRRCHSVGRGGVIGTIKLRLIATENDFVGVARVNERLDAGPLRVLPTETARLC